jgi:hypothetical protein
MRMSSPEEVGLLVESIMHRSSPEEARRLWERLMRMSTSGEKTDGGSLEDWDAPSPD